MTSSIRPVGPGVALVTGACSGIGRALAEGLAERGHDLVLVSQREGPIGEAAREIAAAHGVRAHAITLDLARPEAAGELYAEVLRRGIEIDVLVNNAGVFFFGLYNSASRSTRPSGTRATPTTASSLP